MWFYHPCGPICRDPLWAVYWIRCMSATASTTTVLDTSLVTEPEAGQCLMDYGVEVTMQRQLRVCLLWPSVTLVRSHEYKTLVHTAQTMNHIHNEPLS